MPLINAQRVHEIMLDVLYRDGEPTEGYIPVEGVTASFGLHPQRLEKHRKEIIQLLSGLPDSFMKSKGGGMSFLQAAEDRHGNLWGQHRDMQALFVLGMGIGRVKTPLGRAMWGLLPGGMPYYTVDDTSEAVASANQA
jgi:hypothetical protein